MYYIKNIKTNYVIKKSKYYQEIFEYLIKNFKNMAKYKLYENNRCLR